MRRLRSEGLLLRTGPFTFRIHSPIDLVSEGLGLMYPHNQLADAAGFVDFDLQLVPASGLRRWVMPQVRFLYDGDSPFQPLPAGHAYPLLEWAMNWCIASMVHDELLLHAAVVERDGLAAILPAPAGSGKSTLCAGLINRGWRLLSDEVAMVSLSDGTVAALARPVSLKNESIAVLQRFAPDAVFNRVTYGTTKGNVTHMRAPPDSLRRVDETAQPRWVVFPRFVSGSAPVLQSRSRADSMLELGRNSFNYMVLGEAGFQALGDMVASADCYDFEYSQLDDAVAVFDQLVTDARVVRQAGHAG